MSCLIEQHQTAALSHTSLLISDADSSDPHRALSPQDLVYASQLPAAQARAHTHARSVGGSVIVPCSRGVIMLHFIRALSSFSTLPDSMRMAVRQGKHGARYLSAPLKAASGDGEERVSLSPEESTVNRHKRLRTI